MLISELEHIYNSAKFDLSHAENKIGRFITFYSTVISGLLVSLSISNFEYKYYIFIPLIIWLSIPLLTLFIALFPKFSKKKKYDIFHPIYLSKFKRHKINNKEYRESLEKVVIIP